MKTTQKRTLALLLVLAMNLSPFSAVAFAAETPAESKVHIGNFTTNGGGTVTINASNADDSFALYKVVDITYNSTSNSVKYDFTTDVKDYLTKLDADKRVSVETYQGWTNDSDELKAFLAGYAQYVKTTTNSVVPSYTATASSHVATVSGVALGQYMVLGTGSSTGAYIYQIMTATFKPDNALNVNTGVTLTSKASLPTLAKAADKTSISTNDEVTYTLTIGVPTYPVGATNKNFVVKDVLPAGFDYVADSQSVQVGDTTSVADAAVFEADGQNLTWTFTFDKISAVQTVTITYKVKATTPSITTGNTNTATLTYSKAPFGDDVKHDITASETVYSYEIDITKVDYDNNNIKLADVEFDVKDSTGKVVRHVTTGSDGTVKVSGLAIGKYKLVETKAATGYADPISIGIDVTLSDTDLNGVLDEDTDGVLNVIITNSKGAFNIPTTGDSGTLFFTFAAMALMALAAAIMLLMRRKQTER